MSYITNTEISADVRVDLGAEQIVKIGDVLTNSGCGVCLSGKSFSSLEVTTKLKSAMSRSRRSNERTEEEGELNSEYL